MSDDSSGATIFRVLSLDGGGAKGFYTLGVLKEIEGITQRPLVRSFDIIFGTSTGAIIAGLLAVGKTIDEVHGLYKEHVPAIMRAKRPIDKSAALEAAGNAIFGEQKFEGLPVHLGIVAARWEQETPIVFKTSVAQAHGRAGTFKPGFGVTLSEAVQASCSAYPFFASKTVVIDGGSKVELIDGGFCANNPAVYAIADALGPLAVPRERLRVVSVGTGSFPEPVKGSYIRARNLALDFILKRFDYSAYFFEKTLHINTGSMEALRYALFKDIATVRINNSYTEPHLACDFLEYNLNKLDLLYQRGRQSIQDHEAKLRQFLVKTNGRGG